MNNRTTYSLLLTAFIATAVWGQGQDVLTTPAPPPLASYGPGIAVVQKIGTDMGFQFVSGEPAISIGTTQPVKGSPYSLETTIESAQTLNDGNRIVHRQTVHLYRDSSGRTRREETLAAIGPWAASGTPPTLITIQDPISGASYFLDPQRKVANKLPSPPPGGKGAMVTGGMMSGDLGAGGPVTTGVMGRSVAGNVFYSPADGRARVVGFNAPSQSQIQRFEEKSESLGTESVAGLAADGTRTTTEIPTNAIGNERPLDIVRERWYSRDLQIVLRSTQTDPRFGETTYEVTTIDRKEPPPSLFTIPPDYTINEGDVRMVVKGDAGSR